MSILRYVTSGLHVACLLATAGVLEAQEVIELPGEDRRLEADFEEVYRIGSLDGQDWEQFGNVRKVTFDGAGQLYVFDDQAHRIFVVGPDGEYRRSFGGPGEGPGEFRNPAALAVFRDGRAVVADTRHRAYHIFDANGDSASRAHGPHGVGGGYAAAVGSPAGPGGGHTGFCGGSTDARHVVFLQCRLGLSRQPPPHASRPVERLSLTGEVATKDTVAEGWLPQGGEPPVLNAGGIDVGSRLPPPRVFATADAPWGVLPDGDGRILRLVGLRDQALREREAGFGASSPGHSTRPR